MPKTWLEKFNTTTPYKIKVIDKRFADLSAGTKMFIATPKIIDNYLKQIPKGVSVDVKTMRKDLAITYLAENSCPVTTSIFLRVVAEVSITQIKNGVALTNVAPFWRVINTKMPVAKKLSCGLDFITLQRSKEHIENG